MGAVPLDRALNQEGDGSDDGSEYDHRMETDQTPEEKSFECQWIILPCPP